MPLWKCACEHLNFSCRAECRKCQAPKSTPTPIQSQVQQFRVQNAPSGSQNAPSEGQNTPSGGHIQGHGGPNQGPITSTNTGESSLQTVIIPHHMIVRLIGKKGSNIKRIERSSNAKLSLNTQVQG